MIVHEYIKLVGIKNDGPDTLIVVRVPRKHLADTILSKRIRDAEMRLDDGRTVTAAQRKKAYATIRDISDYTGYLPEVQKEWLKYLHIAKTGCEYFSLSDCSMDTAREFINTILEYALENGVPLSDYAVNRTDDIGKYLYFCLMKMKCCVCGKPGEIHHVDAIGMGRDRWTVDDSNLRKMCLCRYHHTIAHQRGMTEFEEMYKVYGIKVPDEDLQVSQQTNRASE